MTADQYEAFERALHEDLAGRGWTWQHDNDGLWVTRQDAEPMLCGLLNIAQLCAVIEEPEWPTAIRSHFDHLDGPDGTTDVADDFERVRPLLKLRVYPAADARELGTVAYPLAPDIVAVLAIDFPTTVSMPRRDVVATWPGADELYHIALDNLTREPVPAPERIHAGDAEFDVYVGDSFFTASHLLHLQALPGMAGVRHALVAVPNRHTLLLHPIVDVRVVHALPAMASAAVGGHRTGPGSISPDVYWWNGGALTRIPVTVRDGGMDISPPDGFVELLNGLVGPAEG